jgi:hypothetical protein
VPAVMRTVRPSAKVTGDRPAAIRRLGRVRGATHDHPRAATAAPELPELTPLRQDAFPPVRDLTQTHPHIQAFVRVACRDLCVWWGRRDSNPLSVSTCFTGRPDSPTSARPLGVTDRVRTGNLRDHNPALYHLSYNHHG